METFLFFLSKVIVPFFSPLFILLLLVLILALRLPRLRENRRVRRALLAVWTLGFILSLPLLSEGLIRLWEEPLASELPPAGPEGKPAWDTVVVLGGGLDPVASRGWQISVNEAAERLESAARLYHGGLAPQIVVSGGSGDIHFQDQKEGPLMKRLLMDLGVPESVILVDADSRNSFENATATKALLKAQANPSVLLVTSAIHMKRSAAIFRKAGFQLQTFAVDSLARPITVPESLIPSALALDHLSRVVREMVGYGYYLILGRL